MVVERLDSVYQQISSCLNELKIPVNSETVSQWALSKQLTENQINAISEFCYIIVQMEKEKKQTTMLRLSRIPQKKPKTFSNFDASTLSDKGRKAFNMLKSLPFIDAKRNVIIVGPTGVGKTHIAEAIGNECCARAYKTYFLKLDELKEKFALALEQNRAETVITNLAKFTCLIIDEVGYCKFTEEETRLFFRLVDRIYEKSYGSIIMTSNHDPSSWSKFFSNDDALECALDRIIDNAICINIVGQTYRGQEKETITMDFLNGINVKI